MIDNKIFWFVLVCAVALLSGCLSREAQYALAGQVPYGLGGIAAAPYGSPQRGYTSANTATNGSMPRRAYTSKVAAAGWGENTQAMTCMQNIDQAEMEKFSQESQQLDAEIKSLCAQGLRDKAMKQAMAFGKKMASSKFMQDMKKCGPAAKGMTPAYANPEEHKKHHVCDG